MDKGHRSYPVSPGFPHKEESAGRSDWVTQAFTVLLTGKYPRKARFILKPDHPEQPKAVSRQMERFRQVFIREGAAQQQEIQSVAAVHRKPIMKVFPW